MSHRCILLLLLLLLLLQQFYIAPIQDCLLRSTPSPASVKHNGLEGREEGGGAINGYLAESDRKPIPGRRASNRKGMALPSGSLRAGNNKFRLECGLQVRQRYAGPYIGTQSGIYGVYAYIHAFIQTYKHNFYILHINIHTFVYACMHTYIHA